MAENKTKPTEHSVTAFLNGVQDQRMREDCFALIGIMRDVSKLEPVMWGSAIVGFGTHHYVYESGREGDILIIGFAPRAGKIALYLHGGAGARGDELTTLGKYKASKGCLYIKTLGDVDLATLRQICAKAFEAGRREG